MLLSGKKILITGILSNRSIAYGVAKVCQAQGAQLALSYHPRFEDRVWGVLSDFEGAWTVACDLTSDNDMKSLSEKIQQRWGCVDGVLHSVAFADKCLISGDFLDGVNREAFLKSMDISVYSWIALIQTLRPLLSSSASLVTMTYLGAQKAIPNYNMMGVAKSALESSVRYMASSLGVQGVRVNGVSSGVIKTLAASGIKDFDKILNHVKSHAPLRRNVTQQEVGQLVAFLLSDFSSAMTGQIVYADAGFSSVVPFQDVSGEGGE